MNLFNFFKKLVIACYLKITKLKYESILYREKNNISFDEDYKNKIINNYIYLVANCK